MRPHDYLFQHRRAPAFHGDVWKIETSISEVAFHAPSMHRVAVRDDPGAFLQHLRGDLLHLGQWVLSADHDGQMVIEKPALGETDLRYLVVERRDHEIILTPQKSGVQKLAVREDLYLEPRTTLGQNGDDFRKELGRN